MKMKASFRSRIRPFVDAELDDARRMRRSRDERAEFRHLERAHVLGQASTIEHVRVHALMFAWAVAAVGFLRRSEREGDALSGWLAIAAVLSAYARFNYFLFHGSYPCKREKGNSEQGVPGCICG